jgi:hypothetical protein
MLLSGKASRLAGRSKNISFRIPPWLFIHQMEKQSTFEQPMIRFRLLKMLMDF